MHLAVCASLNHGFSNAAFHVAEPVTIKLPTDLYQHPAGLCTNAQVILRSVLSGSNLSAEKTLSPLTTLMSAMILSTAASSSHHLKSSRKAKRVKRIAKTNCSAHYLFRTVILQNKASESGSWRRSYVQQLICICTR